MATKGPAKKPGAAAVAAPRRDAPAPAPAGGGKLRPEVYLFYCSLLGMVALDISMEHQIFYAQDEAQLKATTNNAKYYFLHNVGPHGALANVVPLCIVGAALSLLYRLATERRLLDLVHAGMLAAGLVFFKTRVEPLETSLAAVPDEAVQALRFQLTQIFFGHVLLLAVLLVGIVLHLFASPPSRSCRAELLALWVGAGMTMLDSTFDVPVMLSEGRSMLGAFINNTCHIHTYVHEYLVPAIFGFVGLMLVARVVNHRHPKDILGLAIFVACLVWFTAFVETREKAMLAAGVPSRDAILVIGAGHVGLTACIALTTWLGLTAQADLDRAARRKKAD